jgi:hypothetical protein
MWIVGLMVIAAIRPGALTFSTLERLAVPDATALYREYVVLTTLNEKGSNIVAVTRPGYGVDRLDESVLSEFRILYGRNYRC